MNKLHLNIPIRLSFSVLEEGLEIWELIQCSSGTRFDSCMEFTIDIAEEAESHDEEKSKKFHCRGIEFKKHS
jgi:hypothetical protein